MPPSSRGRSGFSTIRTAAHLSHNRRGIPSHGVSTQPRCPWAAATRFCLPAISFITDLPRQATLFDPLLRRLAFLTSAAGELRPLPAHAALAASDSVAPEEGSACRSRQRFRAAGPRPHNGFAGSWLHLQRPAHHIHVMPQANPNRPTLSGINSTRARSNAGNAAASAKSETAPVRCSPRPPADQTAGAHRIFIDPSQPFPSVDTSNTTHQDRKKKAPQ
jgi:hypothetical protein